MQKKDAYNSCTSCESSILFLFQIFSKINDASTRKFLLDAMPLVGTANTMTVMRDLYMAKEITSEEMDRWLFSLAFHKNPTLDMISAVKV